MFLPYSISHAALHGNLQPQIFIFKKYVHEYMLHYGGLFCVHSLFMQTSAMKQKTLVAFLYGSLAIRHLFRTSNIFGMLQGRTHEIFKIPCLANLFV